MIHRDEGEGYILCPDNIAVIGGGRWARVLTEALCLLVPCSVGISVHSPRNAGSMATWASERGWGDRIYVFSDLPQFVSGSSAVIVVNAARDHERAIEWALSAGVPVLAEKPITLTAVATQRLADLARSRKTYFAAAHIFLFARYIEKFSKLVGETEDIRFLRVYWMDPQSESRYGEQKQYDPGLPVFADWLPHVLSIVGTLKPDLLPCCEKLEFLRGGAQLHIELMLDDIPCSVQLVRNGDRRQRIIEVTAGQKMFQIDFSSEPVKIISGSETMDGDPDWGQGSRPSAMMLKAFLRGVAGGELDSRLNIEIGLQANQVIDNVAAMYRSAQMPWLVKKLTSSEQVDDDLRYALREILQAEGPFQASVIEKKIEQVRQQFSGSPDADWLKVLAEAEDPSMIYRSIAM
jgi:hypothetical protein